MQEYEKLTEKLSPASWQDHKPLFAGELLLAAHLAYALGNGFWHRLETLSGVRIYLGILICDSLLILAVLLACCVRIVTGHKEEGVFIKGVKLCFLLLLAFGVLGFLNTLILF